MPRVALRVAYDGSAFHGSQRQPSLRTVEGEILAALSAVGAVADPRSSRFQMASRTDAGVSARANVCAVDAALEPVELARAVTANARDLWILEAAAVDDAFHPRSAVARRYRYHLPAAGLDVERFAEALSVFMGRHDFTSFARLEPGVDPVRDLREARAVSDGSFVVATFVAPSFLWNQVRRMVAAARAVARDEIEAGAVREALAGRRDLDLGLAAPEGLVLDDVAYDPPVAWRSAVGPRARDDLRDRLARLDLARAVHADLARNLDGLAPPRDAR
ncbi:MAG TPA: tRNA pseudouridine(38-40) synthase TruA [Candidatus Thermoplasmatota archaeon]|nr:tRNA pseudouridine(38-40) synthase TruA [Candidatus Thermoplasmatota archaeon]